MRRTHVLVWLGLVAGGLNALRRHIKERSEAPRPEPPPEPDDLDQEAEGAVLDRARAAFSAYTALMAEGQAQGLPAESNERCRAAFARGLGCPYEAAAFKCRAICPLGDKNEAAY